MVDLRLLELSDLCFSCFCLNCGFVSFSSYLLIGVLMFKTKGVNMINARLLPETSVLLELRRLIPLSLLFGKYLCICTARTRRLLA